MATRMQKRTVRANGSIELSDVDNAREPEAMFSIGATKRVSRIAGDLSVTATTYTLLTGMTMTFTLAAAAKLFVAAIALGKAPVNEKLHVTAFVDGANLGRAGGLSFTDDAVNTSNLGFSELTSSLASGEHTVELRAKVTAGTGTVLADSTTSIPLVLSVIAIEGDL